MNRSGITFLGNSPELDKEFNQMLLGRSRDVHTCGLPHPNQPADENIEGQDGQCERVSRSRPTDVPIQKRHKE